MTVRTRVIIISLLLALAALCTGCSLLSPAAEATPEPTLAPTPTPEPQVVAFSVQATEVPAAATLTPTPEPTATPIPFSVYAPTVNMSYEELVGSSTDDISKKASDLIKGYPDPKTYYIIVDKTWQVVLVYKRIDDGTKFGKPDLTQPVRYMLCSSGNPDIPYGYDTMSGTWAIEIPKERFYQFINMEAAQYLTLIHSRTYFHSVLYEKKGDLSTFVKESYDQLGNKASHSCIRLTVPDARWLWYNAGYGTTCEVRDGDLNDTDTASIRSQLVLPESKSGVRLKAGGVEWTDNWSIADVDTVLPYKYQKAPLPDGYDENGNKLPDATAEPTVTVDPGAASGGTVDPGTGGTGTGDTVVGG